MALKTNYIKHGDFLYEIVPPTPTETIRGGIVASQKTDNETAEVKLGNDGKLYAPSSDIALQFQADVKAYLTGTTSDDGNSKMLVFDTGVYLDTVEGRLHVTSLQIGDAILYWDSDEQCIRIGFADESTDGGE